MADTFNYWSLEPKELRRIIEGKNPATLCPHCHKGKLYGDEDGNTLTFEEAKQHPDKKTILRSSDPCTACGETGYVFEDDNFEYGYGRYH